jgi:protein AATF/BFR2
VLLPNNRNAFNNKHPQHLSAAQLVDAALATGLGGSQGPREKALGRTRVYRGKGGRIRLGEKRSREGDEQKEEEEEEEDVFDDTDFYQQLLRDVIDARSGNGTSGIGDDNDWLRAQQKARKARKKVDTKASKGRKLRFGVHEKLQNFMVPVQSAGWHEEQIDELFASLLGRGFEAAMPQDMEDKDAGDREDMVVTDGFRVFG